MESDDEEVKDEGYHSQNRGSSEVPASVSVPTVGASGSSENAVEMTEIKTETVALIPPPRNINDYRKDPCSRQASNSSVDSKGNQKNTGEITYIEVESVPVTKETSHLEATVDLEENIPDKLTSEGEKAETVSVEKTSNKERDSDETGVGYEIPLELRVKGVLEADSTETEMKALAVDTETEKSNISVGQDSSEYVECDNILEKQQYLNMDKINMPETENAVKSKDHEYINDKQVALSETKVDYANLDAVDKDNNVLKDPSGISIEEFDFTASEEPHDYMNLSELEGNKCSGKESDLIKTDITKLVKVIKTEEKSANTEKETKSEMENLIKSDSEKVNGDSDLKLAEKSSISQQKSDTEEEKYVAQVTDKVHIKDSAIERLSVKETTESDSDLDNGKGYLVHVGDSEKLMAKSSKKSKDVDRKSVV